LDLAETAARAALETAGTTPRDLDAIIVATASAEFAFPSFACLLQARLGVGPIPAFDLAAACAGFVYGLGVADAMLRSGSARTCLLVGADALGAKADLLELPAGGPLDTGLAPRPEALCMRMRGPDLFRAAVTELLQVTRDL